MVCRGATTQRVDILMRSRVTPEPIRANTRRSWADGTGAAFLAAKIKVVYGPMTETALADRDEIGPRF
jgi:hypothetical protein